MYVVYSTKESYQLVENGHTMSTLKLGLFCSFIYKLLMFATYVIILNMVVSTFYGSCREEAAFFYCFHCLLWFCGQG